jgi:hypothetical protein
MTGTKKWLSSISWRAVLNKSKAYFVFVLNILLFFIISSVLAGLCITGVKKIADLRTAVKDAKAMAGVLKNKYGFRVELLLDRNATREALYGKLRQLAASTVSADSVLIYCAGHRGSGPAVQRGWWIPVDAKAGDHFTYLDNLQVQKAIRNVKAQHVLLISNS